MTAAEDIQGLVGNLDALQQQQDPTQLQTILRNLQQSQV